MNSSTLVNVVVVSRPWLQRLWQDGLDALRCHLAAWRARRRMERELRELASVAALDARMLRDIGLPERIETLRSGLRCG